jgi:hypothetical protein
MDYLVRKGQLENDLHDHGLIFRFLFVKKKIKRIKSKEN